jgi:hypothetical protein
VFPEEHLRAEFDATVHTTTIRLKQNQDTARTATAPPIFSLTQSQAAVGADLPQEWHMNTAEFTLWHGPDYCNLKYWKRQLSGVEVSNFRHEQLTDMTSFTVKGKSCQGMADTWRMCVLIEGFNGRFQNPGLSCEWLDAPRAAGLKGRVINTASEGSSEWGGGSSSNLI